jgi:hypothetical protein
MIPLPSIKSSLLKSQILLCLGVSFPLIFLVIKNFSGSLTGGGDIDYWEYTGFYFAKNLSLLPFPHLDLVNNQSFYPYGTSAVFQPWSIERDSLYAIFYSLFGIGPWLQIYYLITVLVTAIVTLNLLVQDYGLIRATGAGLLVSLFSFYAIHNYPHHLCYAVLHWTVLSLVVDFLIVKRVTLRQHVSLRLILLRACLLILSLGQELGYIAGFALMSFTISTGYIIVLLSYRYLKREWRLINSFRKLLNLYKNEFFAYPRICLALLSLTVVIGYIYLPLVVQISREAKSFDFTGVPNGAWWANPLRLLIPFFPSFNPGKVVIQQVLGDSPEGWGAGSPGWFLLILGTVGLWQARQKITIFIPLIIIFLLCLFYHPVDFPTLKLFPWFAFNRAQDRCTVIYPVIFCLFALHIQFEGLHLRSRQFLPALLVCLACTELFTAYSLNLNYQPYLLENNFFTYMNYVKVQPGEAVLDWPFCASGGNGVGLDTICPYFFKNGSIFSLRRFHQKKVMGQYFGRLHPSQIKPYLQAGWSNLFFPDSRDVFKAAKQKRCFRPQEWSFFTNFYKFNDFAGINLYVDLLPENCANEFYARFGTPTAQTKVPWAGQVKFITKTPQLRQVDLALGINLKFEPFLDISEADLLRVRSPYGLTISGLSEIEKNAQGSSWRWALGPETRLSFKLPSSQSLALVFSFVNPISSQDVVVEANGVTVGRFVDIKKDDIIKRRVNFKSIEGLNTVVFKYKNWNKNQVTFAPNDPRPMAIKLAQLAIEEQ